MTKSAHPLRAIGCALGGFFLWVLADTLMKLAGEANLPPYEVIGFLGIFIVLIMAVESVPSGGVRALWPKSPRAQFGRALLALGSNMANVVALKHLPLALFYVTVFTAPMMVALLAWLALRERLTVPKILAILVGFVGVVIAIDPVGHTSGGDWIGYAAATFSTVCFALSMVWLRRMTQSESVRSLVFFSGLIEVIFGVGAMLLFGAAPLTVKLLLILAGMGLFNVAGNALNYLSLRLTPSASTVAQFHYTQLISGAAIGYIVWHEVPGLPTVVGAAIIIMSGLYMASIASQSAAQTMAEAPGHDA